MSEFSLPSLPRFTPPQPGTANAGIPTGAAVNPARPIPPLTEPATQDPFNPEKLHLQGQAGSAQSAIALPFVDPSPPTNAAPVTALAPASSEQIQQAVEAVIKESFAQVPDRAGESRHMLNRRLQMETADPGGERQAIHYDGSDIVVIAFEGTGAFEPRRAPIMQAAAERLRDQGLSLRESDGKLYNHVTNGLQTRAGSAELNWSGLAVGPLGSMLEDDAIAGKTQWLSFPSEELELFARPDAYQDVSVKDVLKQSIRSQIGETYGINSALLAVREIQAQAKQQGKNPKIVLVSHSSGGRSAVKFLEKAKSIQAPDGKQMQFPFVMTIDPVREAHEAIAEAGKELLNKGTEHNANRIRSFFGQAPRKVYPPLVRSRSQPESLYKPGNTGKFINFYQKNDTLGLKMGTRFGIQGSPVEGAKNSEIFNLSDSGHGEISYQPQVTEAFTRNLKALLDPK